MKNQPTEMDRCFWNGSWAIWTTLALLAVMAVDVAIVLADGPATNTASDDSPARGQLVPNPSDSERETTAIPELSSVSQRMDELVATHQLAGAITLVSHRDRIVHYHATGWADLDSKRPMTRGTMFAVASMTKPITATALMMLWDEGKVDLDSPVSRYLPLFRDTLLDSGQRPYREVTVRDCLRHTAGFSKEINPWGTVASNADLVARAPLAFEPGTRFRYGAGLDIIGRIIEVVSGEAFEPFLKERIFTPLGMTDSTFRMTPEQSQRLAKLYQPTANKPGLEPSHHWLHELRPDAVPAPGGGLFATIDDMLRFQRMLAHEGQLDGCRILSRDALRQMTSNQTGGITQDLNPGTCWGLGFTVAREPQDADRDMSAGAFGHGGAFGTMGWIDPQRDIILLLMTQRFKFERPTDVDVRTEFRRLVVEALD